MWKTRPQTAEEETKISKKKLVMLQFFSMIVVDRVEVTPSTQGAPLTEPVSITVCFSSDAGQTISSSISVGAHGLPSLVSLLIW